MKGETYRPIAITPPVMVTIEEDVLMFADESQKKIDVRVTAGKKGIEGTLRLNGS